MMMIGSRHVRALGMVALAIGCASGGEGGGELGEELAPLTSGAGELTWRVNDWKTGYCVDATLANRGTAAITDWRATFDLKQATVTNSWNVTLTGSVATPLQWNKTIAARASITFGFCATKSATSPLPEISALSIVGGGTSTGGSGGSGGTTAGSGGTNSGGGGSGNSGGGGAANGGTASGGNGGTANGGTASGGNGGTANGGTGGTSSPGTCSGYATRFWDCCKPHCSWRGNVPASVAPLATCSKTNGPLGDPNAGSSCSGGSAHMCYGLAPYAVNSNLAYGYAATSSGDVCGRCYQLDFDGTSHNGGNDPGSAALRGKRMIVQAINIGYDVGGGQFDLLIPGGGVGAFDACSSQWGVSKAELGAQYGGLLTACKQEKGWGQSIDTYKSCVAQKCQSIFGSRGLTDLAAGCQWFVDWFQAADNPSLKYKEVACPAELTGESGMNRASLNDVSRACGG